MAGSLPHAGDKHPEANSLDNQIPFLAISMQDGETILFSLEATDMAGNKAQLVTPPLTIDVDPPVVSDFTCSAIISVANSQLTCQWQTVLDEHSPVDVMKIGFGTEQLLDDLVPFTHSSIIEHSWSVMLMSETFALVNGSGFVTYSTSNKVNLESYSLAEVIVDNSAPEVGDVGVITPDVPNEPMTFKPCQRSVTTMKVILSGFSDPESGIARYY